MAETIHTAINQIMREVGYVQKQKAQNLNYTYAGEAALIEALRPAMVEHGVYCYVEDVDEFQVREYTTAKGALMVNATVRGRVRFVHAESGSSILVTARGEGSDSGDKASNKAMTGMYKYALRQTFCIETGDDPDKDASESRAQPARPVVQGGKPKPPAPMADAAKAMGGQEVPADVLAAMERTTSKGTRYDDLKDSQLEFIIGSDKAGDESKSAAKLLLDWRIKNGVHK